MKDSKEKLNQTTPGPGQYSPRSNKFKKSYGGYYMAGRSMLTEKGADVPGPGAYNTLRTSLKKQSIKIGNSKRLFEYHS
jgi:hypothetical protein